MAGQPAAEFNQWICIVCGWIYDEAAGDPASNLAPGTRWADVSDDWLCPDCGVGKAEFDMVPFSALPG